MIRIEIHIRTTNPLNGSQGRTRAGMLARAKTRRKLRECAFLRVRAANGFLTGWSWNGDIAVALTRIAPRKLDSDGWQAAAKPIRDGVADALGIDDADPRVEWRYAQEKGKPREYAVRVEVVPR